MDVIESCATTGSDLRFLCNQPSTTLTRVAREPAQHLHVTL